MITRIREVRRARGMTLDDVARACDPPTTPQTIGRLETGTRTVSVGWLNRIAKALGVEAQDLVEGGEAAELNVAAILGPRGAMPRASAAIVVPPRVDAGRSPSSSPPASATIAPATKFGAIRSQPEGYAQALNRDVLVPRPAGRFLFGRLINRDEEKLQILPLEAGGRQQVVANPPWLAVAVKLVRSL